MVDSLAGFGAIVRRQAELGSKVAFADTARSLSFAELERRVDRLVDALHKLGVRPGDRVAVLSYNCVSAVECIAAIRAGFVVVPLNWRLRPSELVALLNDCTPAVLVCDERLSEVVDRDIISDIGTPIQIVFGEARDAWRSYEDVIESGEAHVRYPDAAPDETALLIYTSGTTGAPKAAMISHRGFVANGLASAEEAIGVSEDDTILCVMPMFHVGGLCYYLFPSYMAGATSILRPAFDVDDLVDSLERLGITNVHLVPTMVSDLVSHPRAAEAAVNLRRIVYAGSSMAVALLERAMKVLSSCSFSQSYGSTEGGIITALGPDEHRSVEGSSAGATLLKSCGRPLARTNIRIVDDQGLECPTSILGEVLVRSERTMTGYWNNPKLTADTIVDGYIRTGDIGCFDDQGYLYLVDRKGDMIITGGENVYPSEVEQILYRCPDIAEASVFGMADERWVEKVVAAVVLRPGSEATSESIIQYVRQNAAGYKCPKAVYIMSELPRTGAGKISRKHLRQMHEGSSS